MLYEPMLLCLLNPQIYEHSMNKGYPDKKRAENFVKKGEVGGIWD
jgi:hypothetical protein